MIIYIDINGKKNNIWGKDAFIFQINKSTGRFEAYNIREKSEDVLKQNCYELQNGGGRNCAALIQKNGWKIPKDYPIRF